MRNKIARKIVHKIIQIVIYTFLFSWMVWIASIIDYVGTKSTVKRSFMFYCEGFWKMSDICNYGEHLSQSYKKGVK